MNTGGTAYPQHGWTKDPEVAQRMGNQGGMTLLDWMAGQALEKASKGSERTAEDIAKRAYYIAKSMLDEKARREADHSGDVTKMVEINRELVKALKVLVCASEDVQSKGYAFAQLDGCVVLARAALAKAKEAKP